MPDTYEGPRHRASMTHTVHTRTGKGGQIVDQAEFRSIQDMGPPPGIRMTGKIRPVDIREPVQHFCRIPCRFARSSRVSPVIIAGILPCTIIPTVPFSSRRLQRSAISSPDNSGERVTPEQSGYRVRTDTCIEYVQVRPTRHPYPGHDGMDGVCIHGAFCHDFFESGSLKSWKKGERTCRELRDLDPGPFPCKPDTSFPCRLQWPGEDLPPCAPGPVQSICGRILPGRQR